MLSHDKLDVYKCSVQFFAVAAPAIEEVPRGYGELKKQFRRASLSLPLNIAEATGKNTERDRAKYYAIARGSAHECSAILDALEVLGAVDQRAHENGKRLLTRIVSMLTKMCYRPEQDE